MDKKISVLFSIYDLSSGGAERSLINLLDMIDYSRYHVDLLLFEKKGLFLSRLNQNVNLLPVIPEYNNLKEVSAYCKWALLHLRLPSVWKRIIYNIKEKKGYNMKQKLWDLCWSKRLPLAEKEYDVAIGFDYGYPDWYVASRTDAKYKIGWIHTDYSKIRCNKEFDLSMFQRLDRLVCDSEECTNTMKSTYSSISSRCRTLKNLMSPAQIRKMAQDSRETYPDNHSVPRLLSIGNLCPQKGYDMAIRACHKLRSKGIKFVWYIIGSGEQREQLDKMVEEYGIRDCFIFLGERNNPYAYLQQADIYVQPSYYEGSSVTIEEAKILYKPIVATKYPSVYEQIRNEETGILVDIDFNYIAGGIERLIINDKLRSSLTANLRYEESIENEELQRYYKLFERIL